MLHTFNSVLVNRPSAFMNDLVNEGLLTARGVQEFLPEKGYKAWRVLSQKYGLIPSTA